MKLHEDNYLSMQRNYVFAKKDELPFEYIMDQWGELEKILQSISL